MIPLRHVSWRMAAILRRLIVAAGTVLALWIGLQRVKPSRSNFSMNVGLSPLKRTNELGPRSASC
jgi:hypothetical protein